MCVICVDMSHCVTTNQENRMSLCCGLCCSRETGGTRWKGKRKLWRKQRGREKDRKRES